MRILMIAPNFKEPNSWMASAYNTALALNQAGHDVAVVTSKTRGSKKFEIFKGVRVQRLPCFFIPDPFNYTIIPFISKIIRNYLKYSTPDVVIINKYMFYTSFMIFWCKLYGIKTIIQTDTFPGVNWFTQNKILNMLCYIYSRTIGKLILRLADMVVIMSPNNIKPAKKLGIKKLCMINTCIDVNKIKKLKFNKSSRNIDYIWVGRLDAVKNYKLFLLIAKILHQINPNSKIVMICGSKYPNLRKSLEKKYPFIDFYGYQNNIFEWFYKSKFYVMTSIAEGNPATILESIACGCKPLISKNVGAISYMLKNNINNYSYEKIGKDWNKLFKKMGVAEYGMEKNYCY